jgi:fimbrial chaperone protein
MIKILKPLVAIAMAAAAAAPLGAQRVAPMIYELSPAGESSSTVVRLENNQTHPVTIEVIPYQREIAPDGTESRQPAEDDFLIFPPQSIVQPGATQAFRIRYIGNQQIDKTKMYVISVNQLPLETEEARRGLQFVVNFATAAYVTPNGMRSEVSVVSAEPDSGKKAVKVTVKNDGPKYASLALSTFTIRNGAGQSFTLTGEPLRQALGLTIVPAKGSRMFSLPIPENFSAAGPLTAQVQHDGLSGAS